jgi:hypothetical protein
MGAAAKAAAARIKEGLRILDGRGASDSSDDESGAAENAEDSEEGASSSGAVMVAPFSAFLPAVAGGAAAAPALAVVPTPAPAAPVAVADSVAAVPAAAPGHSRRRPSRPAAGSSAPVGARPRGRAAVLVRGAVAACPASRGPTPAPKAELVGSLLGLYSPGASPEDLPLGPDLDSRAAAEQDGGGEKGL